MVKVENDHQLRNMEMVKIKFTPIKYLSTKYKKMKCLMILNRLSMTVNMIRKRKGRRVILIQ